MDSLRIFRIGVASLLYLIAGTTVGYAAEIQIEKETTTTNPDPLLLAVIGGGLVTIGLLMRHRNRKLQRLAEERKEARQRQRLAATVEN